jgi:hypothetical protein
LKINVNFGMGKILKARMPSRVRANDGQNIMEEPVTPPPSPNGMKRLLTAYVWALLGTHHF